MPANLKKILLWLGSALAFAVIAKIVDIAFPLFWEAIIGLIPHWPAWTYAIVVLILIVVVLVVVLYRYKKRNVRQSLSQKPEVDGFGVYRPKRVQVFDMEWRPAVCKRRFKERNPYLKAEEITAYIWLDGPHCPKCHTLLSATNQIFAWHYDCPKCKHKIRDKRNPADLQCDAVEAYRSGVYTDVMKHDEERQLWNDMIYTGNVKGALFKAEDY